jgi:hypothetical protein
VGTVEYAARGDTPVECRIARSPWWKIRVARKAATKARRYLMAI